MMLDNPTPRPNCTPVCYYVAISDRLSADPPG